MRSGTLKKQADVLRMASSVLLLLCGYSLAYSAGDSLSSRSPNACINVSGKYVPYGEPLPGSPPYFIVRSNRLGLVEMLGLYISKEEASLAQTIELLQNADHLRIILHSSQAIVTTKNLTPEKEEIICQEKILTFRRAGEARGEGANETFILTRKLRLEADGALAVEVDRSSRNSFIFFSWENPPEHYAARFTRKN